MTTTTHAGAGFPGKFPEDLVNAALDDALAALTSTAPLLGISALQGTGKSTLAAQIAQCAEARGLHAAVVSIDDFYLRRHERETLARDVHPLLRTRGPAGTHDVALALRTLDALKRGEAVALPRFDKLADERLPEPEWPRIERADLIVFEGWFLATPAQRNEDLHDPLNALERDEDAQGHWRKFCNDALARDYPPLWQRIDALWFLQPPSFEIVPEWRWQQEQALSAKEPSRCGMSRGQVARFVMHYERISRQALRALPALADRTIPLDRNRNLMPRRN